MQVSVESTGALERRLTVQIPAEKIEQEVEKRLRDLSKQVRLSGFRPGKVPFKVVQRRYGIQVRGEVVDEMVRTSYQEAIVQEKLNPAGGPKIEPEGEIVPGQALQYNATFEVFPEIDEITYSNITISKPEVEIGDADLDNMLDKLRKQRSNWETVERAAQTGDQLEIAFEGTVGGETFEGNRAENFKLELGSGRMIPGFEDQLIGAATGDHRTVEVSFPETYHAEKLAGKDAKFEVDVLKVEEPKLPEIDEEFAKSFGIDSGNLEQFNTLVRENMSRELDSAIRAKLRNQVIDGLLENNKIELPKVLVDHEIDQLVEQVNKEHKGANLNGEKNRDLFKTQAEKKVALGLLFREIIDTNNIVLDQQGVQEQLRSMAASYEQPEQIMHMYQNDANMMESLHSHVLENQVIDFILERANIETKSVSFDEIMNQTTHES